MSKFKNKINVGTYSQIPFSVLVYLAWHIGHHLQSRQLCFSRSCILQGVDSECSHHSFDMVVVAAVVSQGETADLHKIHQTTDIHYFQLVLHEDVSHSTKNPEREKIIGEKNH